MADTRVGTIGWNFSEWKGGVYSADAKPEDYLEQYGRRFRAVESASSYYGMPKTTTAEAWANAVPEGFEVSLKIPDWLTTKGPNDPDTPRALGVFVAHMQPLVAQKKLGTVLAQFHPSYRRDKKAEEFAALVPLLPKAEGFRWAIELRDDSWWVEETYEILRAHDIALVWSYRGGDLSTPPVATTDRLYLRLFGDRDLPEPFDRKRRDATGEMQRWVDAIRAAGPRIQKVDVMLSEYLEGYAPGTASTMSEMLGLGPIDLTPQTRSKAQTKLDLF